MKICTVSISFSLLKTCWYGRFFFVIGMIFVCWPFLFIYICLHGLAPSYLADELYLPPESEFQRRMHSASSHKLSVPHTPLNLRRPSFSNTTVFRRSDLEQSSAALLISAVTSRLLHSHKDIL